MRMVRSLIANLQTPQIIQHNYIKYQNCGEQGLIVLYSNNEKMNHIRCSSPFGRRGAPMTVPRGEPLCDDQRRTNPGAVPSPENAVLDVSYDHLLYPSAACQFLPSARAPSPWSSWCIK